MLSFAQEDLHFGLPLFEIKQGDRERRPVSVARYTLKKSVYLAKSGSDQGRMSSCAVHHLVFMREFVRHYHGDTTPAGLLD